MTHEEHYDLLSKILENVLHIRKHMATQADLQAVLDTLKTTIDTKTTEVAALIAAGSPDLAPQVASVQAAITEVQAIGTTPAPAPAP